MPNANTVRQQVAGTLQLTTAPLLGSTITTTQTSFQLNNNPISLTGGGVIPLSAGVTGLYQGTGRTLHVAATGTFTGATANTTTALLELFEVPASVIAAGLTATSFTNFNEVGVSSAITLTTTAAAFTFDARLQLDASGNLSGQYTVQIGGGTVKVYVADASVIAALAGEQDLNFVLALTLGGAETGVVAELSEFRIDLE